MTMEEFYEIEYRVELCASTVDTALVQRTALHFPAISIGFAPGLVALSIKSNCVKHGNELGVLLSCCKRFLQCEQLGLKPDLISIIIQREMPMTRIKIYGDDLRQIADCGLRIEYRLMDINATPRGGVCEEVPENEVSLLVQPNGVNHDYLTEFLGVTPDYAIDRNLVAENLPRSWAHGLWSDMHFTEEILDELLEPIEIKLRALREKNLILEMGLVIGSFYQNDHEKKEIVLSKALIRRISEFSDVLELSLYG